VRRGDSLRGGVIEAARGVIVSDEILADSLRTVAYHWHGNPEAAWWSENGWMLLHLPDVDLWFTSPQARLSQANIQRLPGSRGQLTLVAPIELANSVIWWVFALSPQAPSWNLLRKEGASTSSASTSRFKARGNNAADWPSALCLRYRLSRVIFKPSP
jgi:hypothetical protein